MSPRGPKPVPRHVREREGTLRPHRHDTAAPEANQRAPRMPSGLTSAMRSAWRTLVADLRELGALHSADAGTLEAAAVAWGRAREARALIAAEGLVHRGDRGIVQHPAVKIEREAWAAFRMLAEQFGLSPSARARLGLRQPDAPAGFSRLGTPPRLRAVDADA